MRRLLKFVIGPGVTDVVTGSVPRWLAVDFQGDDLVAWCEAEVGSELMTHLALVPTGWDAPPADWTYLGTAQHPTLNEGYPFVVHVYWR